MTVSDDRYDPQIDSRKMLNMTIYGLSAPILVLYKILIFFKSKTTRREVA